MAYAAAEIIVQALELARAGYGSVEPGGETIDVDRTGAQTGSRASAGVMHSPDYGHFVEDLRRGAMVVVDDVRADPRTGSARRRSTGSGSGRCETCR